MNNIFVSHVKFSNEIICTNPTETLLLFSIVILSVLPFILSLVTVRNFQIKEEIDSKEKRIKSVIFEKFLL